MGAVGVLFLFQIAAAMEGALANVRVRGSAFNHGKRRHTRHKSHSLAANSIDRYEKCWDAGADLEARDAACKGDLICARAGFDGRTCGDCEIDHCCSKVQNLEKVDLNKVDAFCLKPVAWLAPTNVTHQYESFLAMNATSIAEAAPFSEEGYLTVAKLTSNEMMTIYIERLAKKLGLHVRDKGAMSGMVPHYSGMKTSQTFFALKQELLGTATIPHSWIEEYYVEDLVHPTTFKDYVKSFLGMGWDGNSKKFKDYFFVPWEGSTAPLNEDGYQAIAKLKDDVQMGDFVKRVIKELDLYISDEGKFNGFVQYFSGTKVVQNFALLRYQIIGAVRDQDSWISSGDSVIKNEVGYKGVAGLKDDAQMAIFMRRVAAHHGCTVINEGGFMGVVPHFSGTADVQSFALMEQEIRKSCGLKGSEAKYGKIHDVVGKTGVLQIRLNSSTRYEYSTDALQSANIVPTSFGATDMHKAPAKQLNAACLPNTDEGTLNKCRRREKKLGVQIGLGTQPGCRSKAEQAITDSHRQALKFAKERTEAEWTAVIEDDVVPIHPGLFDDSFAAAWARVPPETKIVRLSWCSFEKDLGSIRKKTFADAGNFRLVNWMSWDDLSGNSHYYTGGCTTGYMVHRSFLKELLGIFPCCCPIDCCMERQLFYAPPKGNGIVPNATFRGEEIMMNLDAWDSKEASFNFTLFNQGGILLQDNRDIASTRPEWMTTEI